MPMSGRESIVIGRISFISAYSILTQKVMMIIRPVLILTIRNEILLREMIGFKRELVYQLTKPQNINIARISASLYTLTTGYCFE